jgi:antitoxin component YwqK of YwqJK toxin-antitoxin module
VKKTLIFLTLMLGVYSAVSAEIIRKKEASIIDAFSMIIVHKFYEDGKEIAVHKIICGGEKITKGKVINGMVKVLDKADGPIYDKTYTYMNYKDNMRVDGVYREYYLEKKGPGKIAGYWSVKNGKNDGPFEYRYKSGKLLTKGRFKNGKMDGKTIRYYESGAVYSEETYDEENLRGEMKIFHENGKMQRVGKMKNCKFGGMDFYDKNGKKLNFILRAIVFGFTPLIYVLFSVYLAFFAFAGLFSKPGPRVDISVGKAVVTTIKKRNKAGMLFSLVFSLVPWAVSVTLIFATAFTLATGQDVASKAKAAIAVFATLDVVILLLSSWYFIANLGGAETVEFDDNSLRISNFWAGFKNTKKLNIADIVKISPVIIEKETGEQYYGTAELKPEVSADSHMTYVSVTMKNDELITFAKKLDMENNHKLLAFLKSNMPGLVQEV